LCGGDLVFSVVGTIGKSLIVSPELEGANITQSSVRIRTFSPIDGQMILRTLQSPVVQTQLEKLKFGSAVQRLNVAHMRRLAIPIPPLEEWKAISELIEGALSRIADIDEIINNGELNIGKLDQSILSKAYRGELLPQSNDEEPASILLQRMEDLRTERAKEKKAMTKRPAKPAANGKERTRFSIVETLRASGGEMSPDDVFAEAGFNENSVDAFFTELRDAIASNQIVEKRSGNTEVLLKVIHNEA
jgi:type I restriction enzyme S subunit